MWKIFLKFCRFRGVYIEGQYLFWNFFLKFWSFYGVYCEGAFGYPKVFCPNSMVSWGFKWGMYLPDTAVMAATTAKYFLEFVRFRKVSSREAKLWKNTKPRFFLKFLRFWKVLSEGRKIWHSKERVQDELIRSVTGVTAMTACRRI